VPLGFSGRRCKFWFPATTLTTPLSLVTSLSTCGTPGGISQDPYRGQQLVRTIMRRFTSKRQSGRGDNPSTSSQLSFWRNLGRNRSADPVPLNSAKRETTLTRAEIQPTSCPTRPSQIINPASPIALAIGRLNTSITRLYRVNGVLDSEFNPSSKIDDGPSSELNVTFIDSEIEKISQLTDHLLEKEKSIKDFEASQKGILPGTARFVKTACQAVAPAAKTILVSASHGSSLVMCFYLFKTNNQVPVLSPYSVLFTSLSKLIEARSFF
jgi:hypothetical protein